MLRSRGRRRRSERGSAIADFALVSVVLVPLFFAIFQLALIWHVKTTLTSAASEGARYGAAYNRTTQDGADRDRARRRRDVRYGLRCRGLGRCDCRSTANRRSRSTVSAEVPVLAFWGPTVDGRVDRARDQGGPAVIAGLHRRAP